MADATDNSGTSNAPATNAKKFASSCVLCSSRISLSDILALPCGHLYHLNCVMYFFIYVSSVFFFEFQHFNVDENMAEVLLAWTSFHSWRTTARICGESDGWSSCPECNHPLELADIMSQAHFDGSLDTKPEAEKMFESYRDVLRKLSDAYMEIMTLKKKELDATVEQLQLKTRLFKLQKKHLELLRENKALKNIVTLNH
uniref:RING-type domain-containing protein n=1 Tax=Wuchereria bancrofti TaxID=6293 RepID=A0A1I8EYB7_WUCBA